MREGRTGPAGSTHELGSVWGSIEKSSAFHSEERRYRIACLGFRGRDTIKNMWISAFQCPHPFVDVQL